MRIAKQALLMIVAVVILIVMFQNKEQVQFRFLKWTYDLPQLLLVLVVFLIGFIIGFVTGKWPRRKQDDLA